MPPKSQQPPNSSRPVSGSSNAQSNNGSESDGLDLRTDLERFINEDPEKRSANGKSKKLKKLMRRISSILPEGPPGLDKGDRDLCLEVMRIYIQKRNSTVLDFVGLLEKQSFAHLRFRTCNFSALTTKDKIMDPKSLMVHDLCKADIFIRKLKSIMTIQPLEFPMLEHYDVVKKLLNGFNSFFDQSTEQSAVIKVAAYSALLHSQNDGLCTKYFPEFSLFSFTDKESPAEVVACVGTNYYRYLLTGRADAFIVSLTTETEAGLSLLVSKEVQEEFWRKCDGLGTPKYRLLSTRLQELVDTLNLSEDVHASYEIIVLEVKKLQPEAKIKGTELIKHLKQVIGECAAIHECGPNQSRFVKFILSDGDRWLFGVLQNPEKNAVGSDTQRECFYTLFDNSDLSQVKQIAEMLGGWMTIPGNALYNCFLELKRDNYLTQTIER